MRRIMLKSKIHRATVTEANLNYVGSLTVDANLLEAADIWENEQIHVWNVTRGTRLITYALVGEPSSGVICVNGGGAHLNQPGDIIIIAAFAELEDAEARTLKPKVIFVDDQNRAK